MIELRRHAAVDLHGAMLQPLPRLGLLYVGVADEQKREQFRRLIYSARRVHVGFGGLLRLLAEELNHDGTTGTTKRDKLP